MISSMGIPYYVQRSFGVLCWKEGQYFRCVLVLFRSYHEVMIADIPMKANGFPLLSCLLIYLFIILSEGDG